MSDLLNIGTRALVATQVALQTTGNNIANVNTAGYSRQSVALKTVQGQFTGGGYIGNGVGVETIQRNYSAFLTRQSTMASATSSADSTRSDYLTQLENIFPGGTSGLGASISDMLNSFSDVANAPTDLTARTVALTRVDETASRMRSASQSLDDLQQGVTQALNQKVDTVNSLAQSIADVNGQIALAQGSGQPPNDLLDKRDELVRNLNQYVQTSSIAADDGSVGIFIGGSQALVLGTTVSKVSIQPNDGTFGDTSKSKLMLDRNGASVTMDENTLGGGEVSGLLRFQNNDMVEGRNLLGRLSTAISTSMNDQHKLGLDLDGNQGGNLFTPLTFTNKNVLPATANTGSASLSLSINDTTKLIASDYEVDFKSSTTGTITRRSDGVVTAFDSSATNPVVLDGLNISLSGTANSGDKFLIKPFSTSASNITSAFSSPRALAVASPVAGSAGVTNQGSMQLVSLTARSVPAPAAVTLSFDGAGNYTRSDTGATTYPYTPGQAIEYDTTTPGATGWTLTLNGAPKAGDTFTVQPQPAANSKLNAGNATALAGLRDATMFDGGPLTDGYAGMIAQIGTRAQSAINASTVSKSIASNLETARTGVSGVNLDEEAAKLLQYQQAYQGAAKMIQIAQTIFTSLLSSLGA